MDFDIDRIMAKISGENVENFANRVINPAIKAKVDFAFDYMFQGLTLICWMQKTTLRDSWKFALEKMIDFIFSLPGKNYMLDYLRIAVFDYKTHTLRTLKSSVHAYEYFTCPDDKLEELNNSAQDKVQQGIDIIKSLVAEPDKCYVEKTQVVTRAPGYQKTKERENERERTKK